MAKYRLTNKAVEDLTEIWNYTYEVWSENQADKYYELIIKTCESLANAPSMESEEIEIVRILHERMDLKNRLKV